MFTREAWRTACEGQLGKPYIWGADGPDAFDCSGFTQWALSLLNLDPPGDQTAEGLYRFFRKGRSQSVPADTATLGDIVFFGSEESVTHVALAWGRAKMLEAGGGGRTTTTPDIADKQGAKVRIVDISRRKDLVEILRPNAVPWAAAAGLEAALEAAAGWGSYVGGAPITEWLSDGRHMQMKRPFGYVQENSREWPVPEGAVVDGASIPRVFWSLIGGPFEGPYRDASIVHDHYCDVQTQPWQDTHRIVYEGMLCSGVSEMKAKVMYYAVYRFGPRWTIGPAAAATGFESAAVPSSVSAPLPVEAFDAASFEEDAELIQSRGLDADAIEQLAEARSSSISQISAEASAGAARQPLLQRLVQLQEAAADENAAKAAGALLRRYSAALREAQPEGALEAAPPYELLKPEYERLFATCMVRPERKGEVAWYVQKLLQYRPRYEKVGGTTEVPWWFIGVVHALEASFNFNGHLHNGDPLSGRTVQVPKGRPPVWNPPNDWETSAIDAIIYEKLAKIGDWSVARALYRWERFNGYGYHARNINSPYLWSFSNHYTRGKYVKDGVFDANVVSKQCGAAMMLRALQAVGAVNLS